MQLGDLADKQSRDFVYSEDQLLDVISNSDRFEKCYEIPLTLHYKFFKSQDFCRRHLLVGMSDTNVFCFGYWIPTDLIQNTLLETLKKFVDRFGLYLQIERTEFLFLQNYKLHATRSSNYPMDIYIEEGGGNIPNYIHYADANSDDCIVITCCFGINLNLYFIWLNKTETNSVVVPKRWVHFFNRWSRFAGPVRNGDFKIRKGDIGHKLEVSYEGAEEVIFSSAYKGFFIHLANTIKELKADEDILVSYIQKRQHCIFCQSRNISSEHIFAKWMRPYFNNEMFEGLAFVSTPVENSSKVWQVPYKMRSESSIGFVLVGVCVSCNTGWMSKIEDRVKSILSNGHRLHDTIDGLSLKVDDQFILSKWIFLKFLTINAKSELWNYRQQEWFSDLKDGRISDGFLIEIIQADNSNLDFCHSNIIHDRGIKVSRITLDEAKKLLWNFASMTLQIGHFYFRISFLDERTGLKRVSSLIRSEVLFPPNKSIAFNSKGSLAALVSQGTFDWDSMLSGNKLALINTLYFTDDDTHYFS
jgi:hypothetical protein